MLRGEPRRFHTTWGSSDATILTFQLRVGARPSPHHHPRSKSHTGSRQLSAQDFYPRWLNTPCGWWVYYEIPPTSQTQPTIRRYVQATEVAPAVTEKALTQDDIANGLQFYGSAKGRVSTLTGTDPPVLALVDPPSAQARVRRFIHGVHRGAPRIAEGPPRVRRSDAWGLPVDPRG
jgi:hypothetical protein